MTFLLNIWDFMVFSVLNMLYSRCHKNYLELTSSVIASPSTWLQGGSYIVSKIIFGKEISGTLI